MIEMISTRGKQMFVLKSAKVLGEPLLMGDPGISEEEKECSVERNKDKKENPAKKMSKGIGDLPLTPSKANPSVMRHQNPSNKLDPNVRDQVRHAKRIAMRGPNGMSMDEADRILREHTGQGASAYKGFKIVVKAFPQHPHAGRPGQRGGSAAGETVGPNKIPLVRGQGDSPAGRIHDELKRAEEQKNNPWWKDHK